SSLRSERLPFMFVQPDASAISPHPRPHPVPTRDTPNRTRSARLATYSPSAAETASRLLQPTPPPRGPPLATGNNCCASGAVRTLRRGGDRHVEIQGSARARIR